MLDNAKMFYGQLNTCFITVTNDNGNASMEIKLRDANKIQTCNLIVTLVNVVNKRIKILCVISLVQ